MPWGGWPDPRRDEDDWWPEEWFHDHYTDGENRSSKTRTKDRYAHSRSHDASNVGMERFMRLRVDKRRALDEEKEGS